MTMQLSYMQHVLPNTEWFSCPSRLGYIKWHTYVYLPH